MPTWLSSCALSCASNYERCALLLNTFSFHPFALTLTLPRSLNSVLPISLYTHFFPILHSILIEREWEHATIIFTVYVTHKNIIQYQKCIHSSTYYIRQQRKQQQAPLNIYMTFFHSGHVHHFHHGAEHINWTVQCTYACISIHTFNSQPASHSVQLNVIRKSILHEASQASVGLLFFFFFSNKIILIPSKCAIVAVYRRKEVTR